jgi:chemotaxis protein MotB
MKNGAIVILSLLLFSSCVSKKKYLEIQTAQTEARVAREKLQLQFENCEAERVRLNSSLEEAENQLKQSEQQLAVRSAELENERLKTRSLEQQMEYFKSTNTNLLDRLSDLSVVNKSGAESIKKSLEALNEQNKYIKDLTTSMREKDSLNLALVINLKRSLGDINDEDVTIEVKKGVVYISLSDKMLFKSGSADINARAEEVLGKIAKVLNDHKELDILVEGHTDNVPIKTNCVEDNWDLSVKRATSVVRSLQNKYNVAPGRMTAGGRSEFVPKASNATSQGKSLNRRTEIIILPKLDQFFQLLEPPK